MKKTTSSTLNIVVIALRTIGSIGQGPVQISGLTLSGKLQSTINHYTIKSQIGLYSFYLFKNKKRIGTTYMKLIHAGQDIDMYMYIQYTPPPLYKPQMKRSIERFENANPPLRCSDIHLIIYAFIASVAITQGRRIHSKGLLAELQIQF